PSPASRVPGPGGVLSDPAAGGGKRPLLFFYRGSWCPFCTTELGGLRKRYREILDRGVEVVAISVDPPQISEALRRKLELPIRILSDVDGTLMDPLHIRHDGRMPPALIAGEVAKVNPSRDIFLATTFLLDEHGVIRWVYRPDTYRMRASIDELVAAIDSLSPS